MLEIILGIGYFFVFIIGYVIVLAVYEHFFPAPPIEPLTKDGWVESRINLYRNRHKFRMHIFIPTMLYIGFMAALGISIAYFLPVLQSIFY